MPRHFPERLRTALPRAPERFGQDIAIVRTMRSFMRFAASFERLFMEVGGPSLNPEGGIRRSSARAFGTPVDSLKIAGNVGKRATCCGDWHGDHADELSRASGGKDGGRPWQGLSGGFGIGRRISTRICWSRSDLR